MRVLGLVSGGKDSCYNLIECIREGHEIVALGNLKPAEKDELDSFMYQTVGHDVVDLYAEAIGLPMFRRIITGKSVNTELNYEFNEYDEVEDLKMLLKDAQETIPFEAVAVGAILSDYQRIRVENVCSRLGLKCLAYLWQREQDELLQDMIDSQVHAVLIKVATLGLLPRKHLMSTIEQIQGHLREMNTKFGINICGEGGEYETMTLDCPLFLKKIIVDEYEIIIHSDDAFAPVGYVKVKALHLADKEMDPAIPLNKRLETYQCPARLSEKLMNRSYTRMNAENSSSINTKNGKQRRIHHFVDCRNVSVSKCNRNVYIAGIFCDITEDEDIRVLIRKTFASLKDALKRNNCTMEDCVRIHLYLKDMELFSTVNEIYKEFFNLNPPTRVCIEVPMQESRIFCLECLAVDGKYEKEYPDVPEIRNLHVQSVSHWAPANIGPYSQARKVGSSIFVSGSIGLDPGSMLLVPGGIKNQALLALQHVDRVLRATVASFSLRDAVLVICYVILHDHVPLVEKVFKEYLGSDVKHRAILHVVTVSRLPRDGLVEWSVVAHRCPEQRIRDYDFETYIQKAKISSSLCQCSCQRNGFLSLSLGKDAIDHATCDQLAEIILEDIKRCLVHCGLDKKQLLALMVYYHLESDAKLKVLTDLLQNYFQSTALSMIKTDERTDQLTIIGYII